MLKRIFSVVFLLLMVSACTSKEEQIQKAIEQQAAATGNALDQLEKALTAGRIRNATILAQYADTVKKHKPELSALAEQLGQDATTHGPLFMNLMGRYNDAKSNAAAFTGWEQRINELQSISEAAQLSMYNDALTDPINVLADMSDGQLPRINAISRETEIMANNAKDMGPGSQLVGNPNYGHWSTDSRGMSFWEWYGMYSMFNNLFSRPHIYYSDWGRYRGYSYYSDYGRARYSSPQQRATQNQVYNKTKKSFASQGKSFSSPYAKRRTGASSLSRSSYTPPKKSSFSRKSSYSRGSVRNSSSRTSRGGRGGK